MIFFRSDNLFPDGKFNGSVGGSKPKSIKSKSNSPVTSTSKNGVIRCPTCEEEYCDPPTEEWIKCFVSHKVLRTEVNKENIWYILQFFFDKYEIPSQAAENVNSVYGADTVTANYVLY
ncbi:hypothetical protein TNCV_4553851 [Trichonephila clavipes]|nr:hypothetical protein TNCV_4553851 [Trichonephila clavipes]